MVSLTFHKKVTHVLDLNPGWWLRTKPQTKGDISRVCILVLGQGLWTFDRALQSDKNAKRGPILTFF